MDEALKAEGLELPEACLVRLIDMDVRVGGLTTVDETGFANIYINARLSEAGRLRALRHELRHHWRGDMFSDADIRAVELAADRPCVPRLQAIDGTMLDASVAGFGPQALVRVGRGLYRPAGEGLARAAADIGAVAALLERACRVIDVAQTASRIPVGRLRALAGGLCADDIAFLAFRPAALSATLPASLQLCREPGDRLQGAIFYDAGGRADNALMILELRADPAVRFTVDLRTRRGRLDLWSIARGTDGGINEKIF